MAFTDGRIRLVDGGDGTYELIRGTDPRTVSMNGVSREDLRELFRQMIDEPMRAALERVLQRVLVGLEARCMAEAFLVEEVGEERALGACESSQAIRGLVMDNADEWRLSAFLDQLRAPRAHP